MDWFFGLQAAVDYIETHLTEKIDYDILAKTACFSKYHFQRLFGAVYGVSVGEYIRKRRLTLAGKELAVSGTVLSAALKYGYETPESFSRAFYKFHGILPSAAKKGGALKCFPRLTTEKPAAGKNIGENTMDYEIKEIEKRVFVGYKKRFSGVPYGEERARQEEQFITSTRAKQWLLLGASCDSTTDYCIVNNIGDDGYDFYIAYELDEWTRKEMFNPAVTGVDFMDKLGFETIVVPKQTYAVFRTERQRRPIGEYIDIRKRIMTEWLPAADFALTDGAEVVALKWRPDDALDKKNEKYVEIQLPVVKNR